MASAGSPLKHQQGKVRRYVNDKGMTKPSDFHPKYEDYNSNASPDGKSPSKKLNLFEFQRSSQGIAGSGLKDILPDNGEGTYDEFDQEPM